MSAAVEQARAELIAALVRAGEAVIGNLDAPCQARRIEADQALEEARFCGIVLNELLIEEGEHP